MKFPESLLTHGRLRAAINLGNPLLATRDGLDGSPRGVSVDLANRLALELGVPLDLVVYEAAGRSVEGVVNGEADVGFFAVDPVRGREIAFSAPYLLIEGCYLVREASSISSNEQVDEAGSTVVVGKGSAYDLFLTRELKRATIIRAPTSPTVVATFLEVQAQVAAGVRQQLQADADRIGGLRLLPGRFMQICQAMGTPKARGTSASEFLCAFVERAKADGFIADALVRHRVDGAIVAPPT
jgi:polar amino acid transport system substrate-binding protein